MVGGSSGRSDPAGPRFGGASDRSNPPPEPLLEPPNATPLPLAEVEGAVEGVGGLGAGGAGGGEAGDVPTGARAISASISRAWRSSALSRSSSRNRTSGEGLAT